MESKDDQAQQPDFKGRPLPVPHPDTLTKAVSLPPSATKDWDTPKDLEIPAHLRRQEPADQHPQFGEPGFGPLPMPVPHMMRVNRSKPLSDPKDLEMPAHLRGPTRGTQ